MNTATKVIIAAVVVGGVAFYGGMKYNQVHAASQRTALRAQFGGQGGQFVQRGGGANAGFTTGDIISQSATSLTIKMRDGSTKIVLLAPSTEISKFVAGTSADLGSGKTISVTGTTNADGSVTANMIQIRPPIPSSSPSPSK
jgi:hypothetical protein